jgi:methionyl-tRNA synthetase
VDAAMQRFALNEALAAIWELVVTANRYVGDVEPWVLAKRRKAGGPDSVIAEARLATSLYNLAEALRLTANYCLPFLPKAAHGIAQQLGIALDSRPDWSAVTQWGGYPAGTTVHPGGVLFPKLELPAATSAEAR